MYFCLRDRSSDRMRLMKDLEQIDFRDRSLLGTLKTMSTAGNIDPFVDVFREECLQVLSNRDAIYFWCQTRRSKTAGLPRMTGGCLVIGPRNRHRARISGFPINDRDHALPMRARRHPPRGRCMRPRYRACAKSRVHLGHRRSTRAQSCPSMWSQYADHRG